MAKVPKQSKMPKSLSNLALFIGQFLEIFTY